MIKEACICAMVGALVPAPGLTAMAMGETDSAGLQPKIKTPKPTFAPKSGVYAAGREITIRDSNTAAVIYYTTDNTEPTTSSPQYVSPIVLEADETINAIAVASGETQSLVGSASYQVEPAVAKPVFSPAAGSYRAVPVVSITDATPGATIYYTTDGSTPTTNSTQYNQPIPVTFTQTIKAIAVASGFAPSAVHASTYTMAVTESIVYSFGGASDAANPLAALIEGTDGDLYGTSENGGVHGFGTVFKLTLGGVETVLHSFAGQPGDGDSPYDSLTQGTDQNFYGTTFDGGANNGGIVFKMTPGGTLSVLHSFPSSENPNPDGSLPITGLVQASNGTFYGTSFVGPNLAGTFYKITAKGAESVLYSFKGPAAGDGSTPGALTLGSDGNFYGVTNAGGVNHVGTVFKLTPGGKETILHSFSGGEAGTTDGASPSTNGKLVEGPDGNFYGTTEDGGGDASGNPTRGGTVFKITPAGKLTILHSFINNPPNCDGFLPEGGLVLGPDGNFYGTTNDGFYGDGYTPTVFEITPAGVESIIYVFGVGARAGVDASQPTGLTLASDGNLYGTSQSGGALNGGTVFKLGNVFP